MKSSKAKALSKLSKQEHKDSDDKGGHKMGGGKSEGVSMKCSNCGSLKHTEKDCPEL